MDLRDKTVETLTVPLIPADPDCKTTQRSLNSKPRDFLYFSIKSFHRSEKRDAADSAEGVKLHYLSEYNPHTGRTLNGKNT